ncbi:hypothetical protein P3T25_007798 [Paraburkholderia sp. GAS32]
MPVALRAVVEMIAAAALSALPSSSRVISTCRSSVDSREAPGRFQTFKKWGKRGGVQEHSLGDRPQRYAIVLPQHRHDQLLQILAYFCGRNIPSRPSGEQYRARIGLHPTPISLASRSRACCPRPCTPKATPRRTRRDWRPKTTTAAPRARQHPFRSGQISNPYVTRYRQPFASCAFSLPLPQQCSSRSTCHRSIEPERGREIGVPAFPSLPTRALPGLSV